MILKDKTKENCKNLVFLHSMHFNYLLHKNNKKWLISLRRCSAYMSSVFLAKFWGVEFSGTCPKIEKNQEISQSEFKDLKMAHFQPIIDKMQISPIFEPKIQIIHNNNVSK